MSTILGRGQGEEGSLQARQNFRPDAGPAADERPEATAAARAEGCVAASRDRTAKVKVGAKIKRWRAWRVHCAIARGKLPEVLDLAARLATRPWLFWPVLDASPTYLRFERGHPARPRVRDGGGDGGRTGRRAASAARHRPLRSGVDVGCHRACRGRRRARSLRPGRGRDRFPCKRLRWRRLCPLHSRGTGGGRHRPQPA